MVKGKVFAVAAISLASAALGALGGVWFALRFSMERSVVSDIAAQQSNAVTAMNLLGRLRNGDQVGAIELCEENLDSSLLTLGAFAKGDPKILQSPVLVRVLEKANTYRKEFPRKTGDSELDLMVEKALSVQK
jgi:hypothetical protein